MSVLVEFLNGGAWPSDKEDLKRLFLGVIESSKSKADLIKKVKAL